MIVSVQQELLCRTKCWKKVENDQIKLITLKNNYSHASYDELFIFCI